MVELQRQGASQFTAKFDTPENIIYRGNLSFSDPASFIEALFIENPPGKESFGLLQAENSRACAAVSDSGVDNRIAISFDENRG